MTPAGSLRNSKWNPRTFLVRDDILYVALRCLALQMLGIYITIYPNYWFIGGHFGFYPKTRLSPRRRGTRMIASNSTFCPHPGRVIRDLFRQLHAVWHGTEALVYSNHPREAAASSYLAIIFGQIASGVPWLLRSTVVLMQLSHQCWRWCRLW